jgi:hypothetical protein
MYGIEESFGVMRHWHLDEAIVDAAKAEAPILEEKREDDSSHRHPHRRCTYQCQEFLQPHREETFTTSFVKTCLVIKYLSNTPLSYLSNTSLDWKGEETWCSFELTLFLCSYDWLVQGEHAMIILHCDSRCLRKCSKESPNRELALVTTTYHLGPQTIVQNIIAHKMEGGCGPGHHDGSLKKKEE